MTMGLVDAGLPSQHFPEDYKHFDLGFRVVREKR